MMGQSVPHLGAAALMSGNVGGRRRAGDPRRLKTLKSKFLVFFVFFSEILDFSFSVCLLVS